MHWSAYEVFSVLSGIVLVGMAFVPSLKGSDRAWALLGGIAFAVYGFYVAGQDSGTWTFPAIIFVIPFAAVLYLLVTKFGKGGAEDGEQS